MASQTRSALDRAGAWFLQSGIQEPSGGVARYHYIDRNRNARISSEITGYAISTFCYLHAATCQPRYLAAAEQAAQFLVDVVWQPDLNAMPFEYGGAAQPEFSYFFDTGIIVRGLLTLWRATGEARWLAAAERIGASLQNDFCATPAGAFHPILSLPAKQPLLHEPRWSREPGCYQLKSALAFLELHEATGEDTWRAAYENALRVSLAGHEAFLPGSLEPERVMDRLHAYCYFLEALLAVADRPEVATALHDGIARTSHSLREIAPRFERSDVCAQLLRVRLLADQIEAVPLQEEYAADEAARVAQHQIASEDATLDGGYNFGSTPEGPSNFSNPVSTAFCLQALDYWHLWQAGEPLPSWHKLI